MVAADRLNVRPHGPLPTREEQINNLKTIEYDVLVIGGGATGQLNGRVIGLGRINIKAGLRIRNVFLGSGSGIIIPDPDPTNIIEEGRKFNIFTLKEGGGTYR